MRFLMLLLAIGVGVVLQKESASIAGEAVPSYQDLEAKALDYRREFFRRGRVVLHVVNLPKHNQQAEFEYRITFDDDRLRFDWKGRLLDGGKWGRYQSTIIDGDRYIRCDGRPEIVVTVAPTDEYDSVREQFRIFHPRALGMDVNGIRMLAVVGLEALLNRADRETPTVTADVLEGQDTWRIDYDGSNGGHVSVWISPSQGYGVVRAESSREVSKGVGVFSVASELKQYPVGGIWYPAKVEQQSAFKDEVIDKQTVTVQEAHFGDPADPTVFTLAGLNLEPGREIADRTKGPQKGFTWDGTEAVPLHSAPPEPVDTMAEEPSALRWWLLVISAVALAALACYFVLRAFRSGPASGNPG